MKTEDQWLERFGGAIINEGESSLHETFGEDLQKVIDADPAKIWTVIEGEDNHQFLQPGFHLVNRIGFIIAEEPITKKEVDSDEWNTVLWVDGSDISN